MTAPATATINGISLGNVVSGESPHRRLQRRQLRR